MSHTRAIWDDGREPGRAVVALGVAVALSAIVVNVAMVGRVSMFFDLWFVLLCLGLALLVRPRDFFTVGVLPPLIMVGAFAVLAVDRPEAIADARRTASSRPSSPGSPTTAWPWCAATRCAW